VGRTGRKGYRQCNEIDPVPCLKCRLSNAVLLGMMIAAQADTPAV
jgi:hypothetical protein